ncbi:CPBP family intramembrane glutamic endopeptidase [Acetobacterium sp.]|uniref:CPBP family intramembrane glutamic endopeptidase n=1 Tax=Acetobacterium sp. TaxID=1872094 RepID=UPI0027220764|nr:CPBP family intramembrane glutamic endopeptidase [Acetobacterium sp.]MDO9493642.1 CPBP family intramembrane metalloprotease [Acetobacterium sp.]
MRLFFSSRHPLRSAIFLGLLPIFFATAAGVISVVSGLSETQMLITQTLSFGISILLGLLLVAHSKLGFEAFGFRKPDPNSSHVVLYFLPLLVAELLPFLNGFDLSLSLSQVGLLFIFAAVVGINEELFFRGLMFKILQTKGVKYAIIASSLLFGIGHAFTALSGSDPLYVIILIIFAGLFGLICAEIVVLTKSIIPVIVWHGLHDFIANITLEAGTTLNMTLLMVQTLILCLYGVFLWRKLQFEKVESVA